jgi:hypothetical protein
MKIVKVVLILIVFIGGILLGFFFQNFPFITWNKEIKIYEVFQTISTLFIGLFIPFLIKKWIDDGRVIKGLISEEAKELISETKKIKEKLHEYHKAKTITEDDKQYLLMLFNQVENALSQFQESLKTSFGEKMESDFQGLRVAYFVYWKGVTGEELMSASFEKVDLDFLQQHALLFNEFQGQIRAFLIKVQKL